MSSTTSTSVAADIWWLRPHTLVLFGIVPAFTALYLLPAALGQAATNVRFGLYFDRTAYLLGLLFFGVLAGSAALFCNLNRAYSDRGDQSPIGGSPRFPAGVAQGLAVLTLGAYFLAFRGFLTRPGSLVEIFRGSGFAGHWIAPKISGVTTLTQLGCVYVTLVLVWAWAYRANLPRRFHVYLWAIVLLTVFRAFVWTERLAIVELVAPVVVVGIAYAYRPRSPMGGLLVAMLPVVALLVALGMFGVTEYFRSWTSHYQRASGLSFSEFTARRFLGYYYTALNNGAGLLATSQWPDWSFSATGHWLRQFPLGVGAAFSYFAGDPTYSDYLHRFGDPEFTNPSGVFSAFGDLGIGGAAWYAAIWGAAMGYWYADFVRGRGLGLLMYPVAFVSLPESLRLLYLSNSRAFLVVVGTALVYLVVRGVRSASVSKPYVGGLRASRSGQ